MEHNVTILIGGKTYVGTCLDADIPHVMSTTNDPTTMLPLSEGPVEMTGVFRMVDADYDAGPKLTVEQAMELQKAFLYNWYFKDLSVELQEIFNNLAVTRNDSGSNVYCDVKYFANIQERPAFDYPELIKDIKAFHVTSFPEKEKHVPQRGKIPAPKKYNRNKYRL